MKTEFLRVPLANTAGKVDRENNRILGYIVAQEGPFKTGRGEFDLKSLRAITKLMNAEPTGLKSRWTHPIFNEEMGTFLGRAKNARVAKLMIPAGENQFKEINAVRADLYLDPTSFDTPQHGNLGKYIMDLADSDPGAFGSSLALSVNQEYRLTKSGQAEADDSGNPLPPIWRPLVLKASDVVGEGDATTSFLSVDQPGAALWLAVEALAKASPGATRDELEATTLAHLTSYLEHRFPKDEPSPAQADKNKRRRHEIDLRRRRNR